MKFVQAHSTNYTVGRSHKIQYIVIHYTANDGDKAISNAKYFEKANRNASAHYFIDDTSVVQSVKDSDTAWHCGTSSKYKHKYCRNNNSIGIEICSRKDSSGQYYFTNKTLNNAKYLIKGLMKEYDISIKNVIRHYDVTGKMCPAPMVLNETLYKNFKDELIKQEPKKSTSATPKDIYQKVERIVKYKDKSEKLNAINYNDKNYYSISEVIKLLDKSVTYSSENKVTTIED